MIPFKAMPTDNLEKFTKSITRIAFTEFKQYSNYWLVFVCIRLIVINSSAYIYKLASLPDT